jgi:hypothetical protein
MTRAILWKELREQLAILIALVVLGAAVVAGVVTMNPPSEVGSGTNDLNGLADPGRGVLLALVLVAGTVIGATLFAGEEELGTASYLYALPVRLTRLFVAKVAAGAVLTTAVISGLLLVGFVAGLFSGRAAIVLLFGYALVGAASFACGVVGSTLAKSTLAASGIGIAFGGFWGSVGAIPAALAQAIASKAYDLNLEAKDVEALPAFVIPIFVIPAALLQAAVHFTAPDRRRREGLVGISTTSEVKRLARQTSVPHFKLGFRRLVWVTRKQLTIPALILGGFALLVGLASIHKDMLPVAVWPTVMLVLAAITGVVAFADEQVHGANRFWSERQLPAGRLWYVKAAGAFLVTLGLAILVALPRVVAYEAEYSDRDTRFNFFHSGIMPELHWGGVYLLALGPTYGLAFGLACGMLFRKPVVAAGTAILLAGMTAALLVPSLLTGGVQYWQVFLPPAVVVFTARRLARPWANDRVATRRGLRTLVGGSVVTLLTLALGIGYRVVEIQDVPESDDDIAFSKMIPTFDDKQPGRDLRGAAARFAENMRQRDDVPAQPWYPLGRPRGPQPDWQRQSFLEQMLLVTKVGWPDDRPDLDRWMERISAGDWIEKALLLRGRPPGVFEDPNEMTIATPRRWSEGAWMLTHALVARGLQLQTTKGDDAAFVAYADAALAATRTGKNLTTWDGYDSARKWVWPVYDGLDPWLARLDGRPDLLRAMLKALQGHEAAPPADPVALTLADQVVVRNSYRAPQQWAYKLNLFGRGNYTSVDDKTGRTEADWLGFAWTVPWEKERLRRLIGRNNGTGFNVSPIQKATYWVESKFDSKATPPGSMESDLDLGDGLPGFWISERRYGGRPMPWLTTAEREVTAQSRMAILKVALRLYQHETGKLPATLDELVPKYLPAVPLDPYDGNPIRYRISTGEVIYGAELERGEPPGRDSERRLNRAEFMAVAAVAGAGVFWPTLEDTLMPPGFDTDPANEDLQQAQAAVSGAVILWPKIYDIIGFDAGSPGPGGPPGGPPVGLGGPPGIPGSPAGGPSVDVPGRSIDDPLDEARFDAVAAVAGAIVQWPLDPVWKDAPAKSRVRLATDLDRTHQRIEIPAGQAILWCVGPDGMDQQGFVKFGGVPTGDIIAIVPLPPKKKEDRR